MPVTRQHTLTNCWDEQVPRTSAGGWQATVGTNIPFSGQRGYFYRRAHPAKKNMVLEKVPQRWQLRLLSMWPGGRFRRALKGRKSLFWMDAAVPECDNVWGLTRGQLEYPSTSKIKIYQNLMIARSPCCYFSDSQPAAWRLSQLQKIHVHILISRNSWKRFIWPKSLGSSYTAVQIKQVIQLFLLIISAISPVIS